MQIKTKIQRGYKRCKNFTYDKIYTIDLHRNSKKKEVCPDRSKDENVFDIMQGEVIMIFVKTGEKKANQLAKIFHYDLFGKQKYDFLLNNSLKFTSFGILMGADE